MKLLWLISIWIAFSAEVKVKASVDQNQKILSCEESWIKNDTLISGCHWLSEAEKSHVKTVYGDIYARNGDYTIRKTDNRIYVVNHLGDLQVKLRDGRVVQIPPGFEFWFSELGSDLKNQMGIIQPVDMKEHIAFLNSMWTGSAEDLKSKITTYQNRWGDRSEMASKFYKGLVQRKIASAEAVEAEKRQRELNEKKRRQANRKLLFDRVFGR